MCLQNVTGRARTANAVNKPVIAMNPFISLKSSINLSLSVPALLHKKHSLVADTG
jgi:hypothetical protein